MDVAMYSDIDSFMLSRCLRIYGVVFLSFVIHGLSHWNMVLWGASSVRWSFIRRTESLMSSAENSVSNLQEYRIEIRGKFMWSSWVITMCISCAENHSVSYINNSVIKATKILSKVMVRFVRLKRERHYIWMFISLCLCMSNCKTAWCW